MGQEFPDPYSSLAARLLWECRGLHPRPEKWKPGTPCSTGVCAVSPGHQTGPKNGFDHIIDHRQEKLWFSLSAWYNGKNWISGCSGVGTAPHLGCGDRTFESCHSDQTMIIRTTLSRWVMCSDLSFLLRMCFEEQGREKYSHCCCYFHDKQKSSCRSNIGTSFYLLGRFMCVYVP